MQQNNEHSIDILVEKMMTEISTESSSVDFTTNVMLRIQSLQAEKSISYQPLISKTAWIVIGICVLVLLGIIIANKNVTKKDGIDFDGMNHFLMNIAQGFKIFQFSTISIYAVLLCTVMFFVQLIILVNRYQKCLEIQ